MDPLELIPDPEDRKVWDNLRRIMEWANEAPAGVDYGTAFLLMGA